MFKLLVKLGNYKPGKMFNSYGGLVSGVYVDDVYYRFDDNNLFKYIG